MCLITLTPWSLVVDHHDHPTTWKNIKWNIFRRMSSWEPKIRVKARQLHYSFVIFWLVSSEYILFYILTLIFYKFHYPLINLRACAMFCINTYHVAAQENDKGISFLWYGTILTACSYEPGNLGYSPKWDPLFYMKNHFEFIWEMSQSG